MKRLLTLAIFIGSFTSFALEPMIGRTLLPVFGGTPSVWVTCLAVFQLLMIGGYFYGGKVKPKLHICLLGVAAAWCVLVALIGKKALSSLVGVTGIPALDVLLCVLLLCGVTFILLSANSTLIQLLSGGDYKLYSVSNAGSLIGLLAYPLFLEPNVGLTHQWLFLAFAIVVYAILLIILLSNGKSEKNDNSPSIAENADKGILAYRRGNMFLYFAIPAVSCALLNAVTTHLTLDVAPMPLLWVMLLGLFLISYIIGFAGKTRLSFWIILGSLSTVASAFFDKPNSQGGAFVAQLVSSSAMVLCVATALHTFLYQIRPEKSLLPKYYLLNVVGGAFGGILMSIVAPNVFDTIAEFPLMIVVSSLAMVLVSILVFRKGVNIKWITVRTSLSLCMAVGAIAFVMIRHVTIDMGARTIIHQSRGFFGTVKVVEAKARTATGEGVIHEFVHGNTVHGIQVRLPGKWRMPTCYYTPQSTGYAIVGHPKYKTGEPMRVNITGLGVGVLFTYARTNDYYRAYEISPDAMACAMNTNYFSFVADAPCKKDVILEDARKGLEAELAAGAEPYDVIIVDAFTGDNLPYHLSSIEAFELYFKMLKPDGVLCVNISNWHLGLEPYIKALGAYFNCPVLGLETMGDFNQLSFGTGAAFFCRNPSKLAMPPVDGRTVNLVDYRRIPLMKELPTDEKGSFISLLRCWQ
jgi:spermidine synthase